MDMKGLGESCVSPVFRHLVLAIFVYCSPFFLGLQSVVLFSSSTLIECRLGITAMDQAKLKATTNKHRPKNMDFKIMSAAKITISALIKNAR